MRDHARRFNAVTLDKAHRGIALFSAGLFLAFQNPLYRSFNRNRFPRAKFNTLVILKEIHFISRISRNSFMCWTMRIANEY